MRSWAGVKHLEGRTIFLPAAEGKLNGNRRFARRSRNCLKQSGKQLRETGLVHFWQLREKRGGGQISVVYNGRSAAASGMDAALCSAEPESAVTRSDGFILCRADIDLEAISAWQNPTCRGVAWRGMHDAVARSAAHLGMHSFPLKNVDARNRCASISIGGRWLLYTRP